MSGAGRSRATPAHVADDSRLRIPARFCGPPGSANGGYVAGLLAAQIIASRSGRRRRGASEPLQVTLRQPPPLDTSMTLRVADGHATVGFGGALIAEAEPGRFGSDLVEPVSVASATAAMTRFAGAARHPFPRCFVCGTARPVPDGLGLRPGRLEERPDSVATVWAAGPSVAGQDTVPLALVWAALDCPGGWSADIVGRPMVLGRITALVEAVPQVGDTCVIVGRLLGHAGRKTFTACAAYDPDGRVLGRAEAVWFAVDPDRFGETASGSGFSPT